MIKKDLFKMFLNIQSNPMVIQRINMLSWYVKRSVKVDVKLFDFKDDVLFKFNNFINNLIKNFKN
jgi:hypothetical protein